MIAKRKRPPERNEMAALRTGDSTDARKRALIGPWMEIKKPAAAMTRTGSKRISIKWAFLILNRLFPTFQRCLKFGCLNGLAQVVVHSHGEAILATGENDSLEIERNLSEPPGITAQSCRHRRLH